MVTVIGLDIPLNEALIATVPVYIPNTAVLVPYQETKLVELLGCMIVLVAVVVPENIPGTPKLVSVDL